MKTNNLLRTFTRQAGEFRLPGDREIHCLAPFLKRVGLPIAMPHSVCRFGVDDEPCMPLQSWLSNKALGSPCLVRVFVEFQLSSLAHMA